MYCMPHNTHQPLITYHPLLRTTPYYAPLCRVKIGEGGAGGGYDILWSEELALSQAELGTGTQEKRDVFLGTSKFQVISMKAYCNKRLGSSEEERGLISRRETIGD